MKAIYLNVAWKDVTSLLSQIDTDFSSMLRGTNVVQMHCIPIFVIELELLEEL